MARAERKNNGGFPWHFRGKPGSVLREEREGARRKQAREKRWRTRVAFGAAAPGRRVLYSASRVLRAPPPKRGRNKQR